MKFGILFFIVFFAANVRAQNDSDALFGIWDAQGKEGYIDVNGRVIITPQFERVSAFSEGVGAVYGNGKCAYINSKGKVIFEQKCSYGLSAFSDGLASVRDERGCGYINKQGKYVIRLNSNLGCDSFSEGRALVSKYQEGNDLVGKITLVGYIDKRGELVIPLSFCSCGLYTSCEFHEGFALARSNSGTEEDYNCSRKAVYFIDRNGKKMEALSKYKIVGHFREGLASVRTASGEHGFIDKTGKLVFKVPSELSAGAHFSEGLLLVFKRIEITPHYAPEYFGYLDRTGKLVIPIQFTKAGPFSEGLAPASKEGVEGYIDRTGKFVITSDRQVSGSFKDGLAYQYLYTRTISERPNHRNIRGYMNKQGKYVWLSPGAERVFDKEWLKKNYVGAELPLME
jgi:hypothetical protein